MANNLGATNGLILAQMILKNLKSLPVISRISTNFGAQLPGGGNAQFGQEVSVPLVTAIPVDDYDRAAGGYTATDSADTNASVTIDKHKHVTREITVEEAFQFDEDLLARHAMLDANSLGNKMVQDLCALVKDAAVPTATQQSVIPIGSFNHSAVVDVTTKLDDRDVTDMGRFGLLTSAYHGALRKDSVVISNNINPSSTAVVSGNITQVDGVDLVKFPGLPNNAESLTGFVSTADGLAIATIIPDLARVAQMKGIPADAKISVVTDQESGLQMLVVEKMDSTLGILYRSFRLMYGVGLGNSNNIEKIASA